MYDYKYFIFFFVIYILKEFYTRFCKEILFLYNNQNYINNFFKLNKCKGIIIDTCYIIHDKNNKERSDNLIKIKSNIEIKCLIHDSIFPNKGEWYKIYSNYSKIYPLLKSEDLRAHGCFLSHITLLDKISKSKDNYVLILEDNVDIIRKIPYKLIVPKDFDIFSLEDDRLGGIYYNYDFIRVTNGCGACGYVVNVKSVKNILNKLKDTILPIDLAYIDLSYKDILKMYNIKKSYIKRSKKINTIREKY